MKQPLRFLLTVAVLAVLAPTVHAEMDVAKELKGNLKKIEEGKLVKAKPDLSGIDYYAIYFSAHWCPPCRKFTPKLVSAYNELKGKHKNFEVIFFSSDKGKKEMAEYMEETHMPWYGFDYKKAKKSPIRDYSPRGIPCLVILDKDGKVLAHSYKGDKYLGPTAPLEELKKLLKK